MESEQHQIILAIESSCDETSASVVRDGVVLSNIIATQKVHEEYGGVVPELASRAHLQNIVPVVDQALKAAQISKESLHAIAFTQAPGLLGALLVGSSFAKGLAQALDIPLIPVHHMQAHVLAHFIEDPKPTFPFLCLTVSGGHTQIVLCHAPLDMEILGETIDDAAGEAFDKIAKMLELPYPGGPLIDKYAQEGNPRAFEFPIPNLEGLNFSFSGVKTAVLYFLQKKKAIDPDFVKENLKDICASVQYTIVKALMKKFEKAAKAYGVSHIGVAGGVSANSGLRTAISELGQKYKWQVYLPKFEYCTDNAAMIAITAHYKMLQKEFTDLKAVPTARAAWK
ncbi:tRNA (adenosine(37)-N6)-threonylcarbamoyltransferase complex transferase subunit TsaD [Taibaiella sp. KBW10]|uniref:tRNA (adenosine(37)-N6)-threonylcarbamoyltransferase complex transferase subunit TsaD n=1 Tax=Taibaiella sp. KBW10 TaxID=2153357 RepID=UPI000F5ABA95|nr:tRNA (adenosine(37)-N6)-threonylcarbamoyltransferase complex transferase subunit TsaD [Taibaiella sp. KBW10]RQO31598.1 tRNA (adenosine(37)-N6)-threonylcarbamoyltransferase complex transferase subunit TsaD [Taibaiella sp. KBW10]